VLKTEGFNRDSVLRAVPDSFTSDTRADVSRQLVLRPAGTSSPRLRERSERVV
jgi:hypothetical protein